MAIYVNIIGWPASPRTHGCIDSHQSFRTNNHTHKHTLTWWRYVFLRCLVHRSTIETRIWVQVVYFVGDPSQQQEQGSKTEKDTNTECVDVQVNTLHPRGSGPKNWVTSRTWMKNGIFPIAIPLLTYSCFVSLSAHLFVFLYNPTKSRLAVHLSHS